MLKDHGIPFLKWCDTSQLVQQFGCPELCEVVGKNVDGVVVIVGVGVVVVVGGGKLFLIVLININFLLNSFRGFRGSLWSDFDKIIDQ